jgi:hypothetical protein
MKKNSGPDGVRGLSRGCHQHLHYGINSLIRRQFQMKPFWIFEPLGKKWTTLLNKKWTTLDFQSIYTFYNVKITQILSFKTISWCSMNRTLTEATFWPPNELSSLCSSVHSFVRSFVCLFLRSFDGNNYKRRQSVTHR